MSDPSASAPLPTETPPPWMNSLMTVALRTPGIRSAIGKRIALITFTGRRSGATYTTPITYMREGDTVTMLTKRFRTWWRNFENEPAVGLVLAGRTVTGVATATVGSDEVIDEVCSFLEYNSQDAKAYNIPIEEGIVDRDAIRTILPDLVLIEVELATT